MPLRPYLAALAGSVCVALTLGGAAPSFAAAPTTTVHHSDSDWHAGYRHADHHHHHWWHATHTAAGDAIGAKVGTKSPTVGGKSTGGTSHAAGGQSGNRGTGTGSTTGSKAAAGGRGSSTGSTSSTGGAGGSTGATSTGSKGNATGSGSTASTGGKSSTGSSGSSAGSGSAASAGGALTVGSRVGGYTVAKVLHLTATAYGPSLQDNYPYGPVDAFGKPLVAGDVAVDPSVIPLNTHLYVAGYKSPSLPKGGEMAVARDTGGAIKGARIDIFINGNAQQVSNFGVQPVTVYVLK